MDSFWTALMAHPFLQTTLLAGIVASIAGGIVGSYVVAKRIVFISGSISHAVLGGIGFFAFLEYATQNTFFHPLLGALFAALFFALLIGWIHVRFGEHEDSIIGAVWSVGMALGIVFISLIPQSNPQLLDFLFGNLLWTTTGDLKVLFFADIIIIFICLFLHQRFLAISFDETQAYLQKQPIHVLYFLLLSLIAVTVVLMIQVVGAILVIAMLSLPAAIANFFTKRLSHMIFLSCILSCIFSILGIYLSYTWNWPPGATIAIVITVVYFCSLLLKKRVV